MSDSILTMVAIGYTLVCPAKEYDHAEAPPAKPAEDKFK